jgi:predicted nucleic acid-binding protein
VNRTDVLLIDASVWVAAFDRGDHHRAAAGELVLRGERSLAGLDLTLYEVANAMMRRHGAIPPVEDAIRLVRLTCGDRLLAVDPDLLAAALRICEEHGLTAYDAAYVAAARLRGWTLVSVDEADLVSKGLAILPGDA